MALGQETRWAYYGMQCPRAHTGWLKQISLVQRSAATWRCGAFIAWTGWTLTVL